MLHFDILFSIASQLLGALLQVQLGEEREEDKEKGGDYKHVVMKQHEAT